MESGRAQLLSLREGLDERRLNLAALGRAKRGKSRLLNALPGDSILPTWVVPLAAIPTFTMPRPHSTSCPSAMLLCLWSPRTLRSRRRRWSSSGRFDRR
jgi:hypothetical protein